jgi:hypothetical protein
MAVGRVEGGFPDSFCPGGPLVVSLRDGCVGTMRVVVLESL